MQTEKQLDLKQKIAFVAALCFLCSLPILWVVKERAKAEAEYQKAQAAARVERDNAARAKAKQAKAVPKKQNKRKKKMVQIQQGGSGQADLMVGVTNPLCYPGTFFGYTNWLIKKGSVEVAKDVGFGYEGQPGWGVSDTGEVTVASDAAVGAYEAIYSDLSVQCEIDSYEGTRYEFEVIDNTTTDDSLTVTPNKTSFCPDDEVELLATYPLTGPAVTFFAATDTEFTTLLETVSLTPGQGVGDLFAYTFIAPALVAGNYVARFFTSEAIFLPYDNVEMTRSADCPGDPPPAGTALKAVLHRWV